MRVSNGIVVKRIDEELWLSKEIRRTLRIREGGTAWNIYKPRRRHCI